MKGEKYLLKIFEEIDKTIEVASRNADMLIIISDHGFNEYRYTININSILYNLGLLTVTWKRTTKQFNEFLSNHVANVEEVKLPVRIHKFLLGCPLLKSIVKKSYRKLTGKELTAEKPDVDIYRSKAFLLSGSSFGIHVKERPLIDFIIDKLQKIKCIRRAYKREEIFHGPHVNRAPQILIEPNFDEGFTIAITAKIAPKVISAGNVLGHHPDGVLIIFGRGVSAGWLSQSVQTVDVVPTILRYMGLPLPVDTDGEPLPNINYSAKTLKKIQLLKTLETCKGNSA